MKGGWGKSLLQLISPSYKQGALLVWRAFICCLSFGVFYTIQNAKLQGVDYRLLLDPLWSHSEKKERHRLSELSYKKWIFLLGKVNYDQTLSASDTVVKKKTWSQENMKIICRMETWRVRDDPLVLGLFMRMSCFHGAGNFVNYSWAKKRLFPVYGKCSSAMLVTHQLTTLNLLVPQHRDPLEQSGCTASCSLLPSVVEQWTKKKRADTLNLVVNFY